LFHLAEETRSYDATLVMEGILTLFFLLLLTTITTTRIVLASIHQPSSKNFQQFTHVILLALGRIVYQGPREHVIDYLER